MLSAVSCKINALKIIDDYCTKEIQPLLLKKSSPIYFGKYTENGEKECYISQTYASQRPAVKILGASSIHPNEIKKYLEALGYTVEWAKVKEPYPAGYSGTGKTRYYTAGYNTYYSLKISF